MCNRFDMFNNRVGQITQSRPRHGIGVMRADIIFFIFKSNIVTEWEGKETLFSCAVVNHKDEKVRTEYEARDWCEVG